jgi:hypothetical protein
VDVAVLHPEMAEVQASVMPSNGQRRRGFKIQCAAREEPGMARGNVFSTEVDAATGVNWVNAFMTMPIDARRALQSGSLLRKRLLKKA